jgi:ribosomal protein L12E/L44/L45/RPP1/RPP2
MPAANGVPAAAKQPGTRPAKAANDQNKKREEKKKHARVEKKKMLVAIF